MTANEKELIEAIKALKLKPPTTNSILIFKPTKDESKKLYKRLVIKVNRRLSEG
jgi:hypothetical protein